MAFDILIQARETWKDSQGNLKGKNHKLFTRGTAAQCRDAEHLRKFVEKTVFSELGRDHPLTITATATNTKTGRRVSMSSVFKPKKQVVQKVPDGYREISRKKKVIAGAKRATEGAKRVADGAEKTINVANRALDWFFAPAAASAKK